MKCPYCGSDNTLYEGIDDGYGESGNGTCDLYSCEDCAGTWETDCIENRGYVSEENTSVSCAERQWRVISENDVQSENRYGLVK